MKFYNQVEPQLNSAERPAGLDAATAAQRPLYHPAAVPRIGRVLRERYRLESLLGMGAMGEVYRATDLLLQQPCAVKLVFPGAVYGLKAHRRFVNEARVVARLFHPNIVEVRDFNEDEDGTKFLVMELLEGLDLHEVLSRHGRLPLPRAMEIIRAVGAALQYAHDLGIVHRDVKPENIFLGTRGRRPDGREPSGSEPEQVKVLDFGLAKLLRDPADEEASRDDPASAPAQLTKGIVIGTMAYLSPEAMGMDSRQVDARADQWSLAVVAYQLLSGRLPFGNPNPLGLWQLWQMICTEEPLRLRALVPTIPEHVDRTIHVALSKNRQDRFPRIADFIRSLGNLPPLGSVETVRIAGAAAAKAGAAAPLAKGAEGLTAIPRDQIAPEPSEPTDVEPYLPGLTRPRLALLPTAGPGGRSVPEFVEPEGALRTLRVSSTQRDAQSPISRAEAVPLNPDLLVTAHYTAEQLIELSRMASGEEAPALVHAAQDVPTAPYRIGARVIKDMDEQFDRTPLPVPRPFGGELSLRVNTAVVPPPAPTSGTGGLLRTETAIAENSIKPAGAASEQLLMTLVPSGEAPSKAANPASEQLLMTLVPSGEAPIKAANPGSEPLHATLMPSGEAPVKAANPGSEPLHATLVPSGKAPSKAANPGSESLRATLVPSGEAPVKAAKPASEQTVPVPKLPSLPVSRQVAAAPAIASRPASRAQPPRPPAAALTAPRRSRAMPPVQPALPPSGGFTAKPLVAASPLPVLPMPCLLTLPGTAPPELGQPLLLRRPGMRRPLWRALGAGSIVLGLLIAVLLGLRLARAKAVSLNPAPQSAAEEISEAALVSADPPPLSTQSDSRSEFSMNQSEAQAKQTRAERHADPPAGQSVAPASLLHAAPISHQPEARALAPSFRGAVKPPGQLQSKAANPAPAPAARRSSPPPAAQTTATLSARQGEPSLENTSEQPALEPGLPASGRPAVVGSLSD